MKQLIKLIAFTFFLLPNIKVHAQLDVLKSNTVKANEVLKNDPPAIKTGADQTALYMPLLKGKTVAVVANPTSVIYKTHLVDSMLSSGIKIKCVFAPEHGFRGDAEAGGNVSNAIDEKTKLQIISLYGKNQKPTAENLKGVDYVVFDIQDVGVRYYTYISTLEFVMDACAENKVKLLVLDRPNPNGFYIDGPVLDKKFQSFVGRQCIPVVHGLTVGEYAEMLNGEGWLASQKKCSLTVINCYNYNHNSFYTLPVKPSPNLPNMNAIYLYPSLGFFEGTIVSVGRGTGKPFQVIGVPDSAIKGYSFTPVKIPNVAENPPYENVKCYGMDLTRNAFSVKTTKRLELKWLIGFYKNATDKTTYFNSFFDKLAGNETLRKQIESNVSETEIRNSWKADLDKYKLIRKKYLLYPDFE